MKKVKKKMMMMMMMMMLMPWHVARGVGSETVSGIASESKLGVGSEVPTKKADSSVSPLSGD